MTLAGFPVQRLHCGWLSLHSKAVRLSTRRRPSAISTLSAFALVATVALGILFAGTEPAIAQNSVSICSRTQQVQTAILAELPDVSDCALVTSTNLAGITMLNLGYQSITTLQAGDFDGLSSLQMLDLGGTQLSTLPDGVFDGLSSLERLDLRFNKLSALPDGVFDGLSSLERLDLRHNKLSALPDGVFDGLSNLQVLDLGYNFLSTLPDGVFDGLSSLERLDLRFNKLSALPDGVFDGLSSLQVLNLGGNQLSTLSGGVFDGLSSLERLELRYNQLRTLPNGVFDGLSGLEVLDLRDNPGSPFVLTMKLEQTGLDTFVVKVAEGAPFAMTTGLTVEGGTLPVGVTSVTIPAGSTTSEAITVAPTTGSTAPVELSLGTAPSLPADFSGLQIAIGHNLASICSRTQQVQTAILAELPDVSDCALVTRGIFKKCVNSQAVYPLSEQHGLKAQERR